MQVGDRHSISRVMALGDSHGNISFMNDALRFAAQNDADAVHVVGDFGHWDHVPAGVEFLDSTNSLADELGLLVTWNDGNHENFDSLYSIPVDNDGWRRVRSRIWHAPRGHMWRWGAINFLAMGGAHSIDGPGGIWGPDRGPGNGWWPEETITDEEIKTAVETMMDWANNTPYPDVDVMFTHDAPRGIPLPHWVKSYPACNINRDQLRAVYEVAQPQLVVHGHYHLSQVVEDHSLGYPVTAVALAHDMSQRGGQFCFIDTDPFTLHPPG